MYISLSQEQIVFAPTIVLWRFADFLVYMVIMSFVIPSESRDNLWKYCGCIYTYVCTTIYT